MANKSILISAYAFYPDFGGLEQQIYLLSQQYISMGFSVDVLTEKTSPELKSHEVIDKVTVHRLPYYSTRSLYTYIALIFGLSAFILNNRKKYSFIILRSALTLYPLVFGFWKKVRLLPIITWVTADTGGDKDEIIILKRWPLYKLMFPFFLAHNYLNSICNDNFKHYLELGIPNNKLTRISNGVDISGFKNYSYPTKVISFLFLGRLIKEKGIFELLQAFKHFSRLHPTAQLYIGGDGAELQGVMSFITKNKLEKVIIYKGVVDNASKDEFYSLGECLINPSYSEGFGLVYSEAAVRKKVIISTDVADLKVLYGSMIYYCNKKSIISIFEALTRVYGTKSFSHLNYSSIIKTFDIKKTSRQILSLSKLTIK